MVLGSIGFLRDAFLNPTGILAILFLIPFIILYLIKPKPLREKLPSLMFMLKDSGKNKINSFFRTFTKDLLLWIQLIVLLAMILAIAQPYINVPKSYLVKQTVLVVDVSASMQADSRFSNAIDEARNSLGSENTIILIKSSPEILVEKVGSSTADKALKNLEVTDTTSNIHDALRLANNYAGPGVKIAIFSDMKRSEGADYKSLIAEMKSKGSIVEINQEKSNADNVGIIDLSIKDSKGDVWIKNYNNKPETVNLEIGDSKQEVLLDKFETKQVEFKTLVGLSKLKIDSKDDLKVDNVAWISTPTNNDLKVLVITNDKDSFEKSNFKLAANLITKNYKVNINFEYAIPPKIPNLNHDLYIIYKVNPDFILPGYIKNLNEKVTNGASLIIFNYDKVFQLGLGELMPVSYIGKGDRQSVIGEETLITKDIEFGQVSQYTKVKSDESSITLAKVGDDPIISIKKLGKGNSLYYGINDDKSTFRNDPTYPVFWRRTIDFLTNRPDINSLNVLTGSLLNLAKVQTIKLPDGAKVKTNVLRLEKQGPYVLEDRVVVANLLSDPESDLSSPEEKSDDLKQSEINNSKEKAKKEITDYLLWIAIIFIFLELIYIKLRGDF